MATLHLPLKKVWFEMTAEDIKPEDYREITPYWVKRLMRHFSGRKISDEFASHIAFNLNQGQIDYAMKSFCVDFIKFEITKLTNGYPQSTDTERIINLEHKGIKVGYGKLEWGAEPNKLYFIIKHGKRL